MLISETLKLVNHNQKNLNNSYFRKYDPRLPNNPEIQTIVNFGNFLFRPDSQKWTFFLNFGKTIVDLIG